MASFVAFYRYRSSGPSVIPAALAALLKYAALMNNR
jgi:hypothetical protein